MTNLQCSYMDSVNSTCQTRNLNILKADNNKIKCHCNQSYNMPYYSRNTLKRRINPQNFSLTQLNATQEVRY